MWKHTIGAILYHFSSLRRKILRISRTFFIVKKRTIAEQTVKSRLFRIVCMTWIILTCGICKKFVAVFHSNHQSQYQLASV